jgi:hypothetical protein
MKRSTTKVAAEVRRHELALTRIVKLRERIVAVEYLCSGTLSHRTKTCGQPSCRCHSDSAARHGPYFDWTRLERGRLAHRAISPAQAGELKSAIANFRAVRSLLRRWERETLRALDVRPTKKR